ncbi:MAG: hypothetical protein Kow0042_17680 [Calditrichia bacterium]
MDQIKPKISPDEALLQESLQKLKNKTRNPEKLKEAARDFESIFINYMLKNMRKTVMKSGLLDSGLSGEIMFSLFDQKISEKIAHSRSLGIADLVTRQLSSESESSEPPRNWRTSSSFFSPQTFSRVLNSYRKIKNWDNTTAFNAEIRKAARKTGVEEELIRSVIMAESGGDPRAVSPKNAQGLMQLMDSTATEVGVKNVFDPGENIEGGAKYLAKLLERFDGDISLTLAAYNAGPGTVEKYNGIPPYRETREYVSRVLSYYQSYKAKRQDR